MKQFSQQISSIGVNAGIQDPEQEEPQVKEPPKEFHGTLRPRISILSEEAIKVEWLDLTDSVNPVTIWTETIKIKPECAAMSQIECTGDFKTVPGLFYDAEGRRHFVMKCEPGRLGVFGQMIAFGGAKEE